MKPDQRRLGWLVRNNVLMYCACVPAYVFRSDNKRSKMKCKAFRICYASVAFPPF
uniref:Uncharacterized protein n=1 Tax=Arundo donax TaxID=35708 RepID=A0A0A9H2K6_ARUDO